MKIDNLLEEVQADKDAMKRVNKIISHLKKAYSSAFKSKEYVAEVEFETPTIALLTLKINKYLDSSDADVREFENMHRELKDICEDSDIGDAFKCTEEDVVYGGDVLRAISRDSIKSGKMIDPDNLTSQIQYKLTYPLRHK